ncbi:MAG: lipid A deacylase LpxR family protein [Bdellovibrionales bacterium]
MINLTTKSLFVFAILCSALFVPHSYGQTTIEDDVTAKIRQADEKNYLSLSIENDVLGGGTDQFYTSGVRLTYFNVNTPVPSVVDELANSIPTFDLNETTSTFFTLGQNIYTPENIRIRERQEDDRPWAAFLYGSVGLATLENNHIDEFELTLGLVGPEALGEQTQKFVHEHLSEASPTPRGWNNQLDFEPGLIISAQRRWPRFFAKDFAGFKFQTEPNINFSLGNIYTYAGAGLSVSLSPDDGALRDKPPRVRPAMPGSGYFETPDNGFGWVLFASLDGRAVGRDIFLDGNSFKNSDSVDKKNFVADITGGVAFTYDRYRLSYSINARSKEFEGQQSEAVFGSVTLSTRF